MRISIIGLPGSGKSTLAQAISSRLSIPYIHLDRLWFTSGGKNTKGNTPNLEQVRSDMQTKVIEAIQAESWVSDGVYSRLQTKIADRADTLIYLDIPLYRRLLNHASRLLRPQTRHPEVTRWQDLMFFFDIIRMTRSQTPKITALVERYSDKVVILRSRKEMDDYVRSLLP
jgi:adenylate kinase family enzyme